MENYSFSNSGFQCDICQTSFAQKILFSRHMRLHTCKKQYKPKKSENTGEDPDKLDLQVASSSDIKIEEIEGTATEEIEEIPMYDEELEDDQVIPEGEEEIEDTTKEEIVSVKEEHQDFCESGEIKFEVRQEHMKVEMDGDEYFCK